MWILNKVITGFYMALSLQKNLTHVCECMKYRPLMSVCYLFQESKPWWWWTLKNMNRGTTLWYKKRSFFFHHSTFRKGKLTICYHCTVPIQMLKWGCSSLNCEFWIALTISYTFSSNLNWAQSVMLEFCESKSAWGKLLKSKQTKLHCNRCFDNLQ